MSQMTLPNSDNGHKSDLTASGKPTTSRLAHWQIEKLQRFTALYPLLVSDDETMSRTLYRSLFQHDRLTHLDTRSSQEALYICEREPVSLVISDIMKPRMNGIDMLHHLRSNSDTWHIPVLFVTGSSQLRQAALQSGADGFITKPYHPNELLQEIWRILAQHLN